MGAPTDPRLPRVRAVADPTRFAILGALGESVSPLSVAALTERFGLNHNTIRQHLAKLVEAGLVAASEPATTSARGSRGRPARRYSLTPAGHDLREGPKAYERLSHLLAEVITSAERPDAVGRRAADGFRVPHPTGDAVEDLAASMARHGFAPEVRDGTEVVLHDCPFESTAVVAREAVCLLHLGIAEGLAEGSGVAVAELVANDPRRAMCRLRLRPAGEGDAAGHARLTLRRPAGDAGGQLASGA